MKYKLILTHIFTPILLGTCIYLLFRSENTLLFQWVKTIGLESFLFALRENSLSIKIPNWLLYSLPDGLWVYAFTTALLLFWQGKNSFWIWTPIFTSIIFEFAQATKIIQGTFDVLDLLFSAMAFTLSKLFLHPYFKYNE